MSEKEEIFTSVHIFLKLLKLCSWTVISVKNTKCIIIRVQLENEQKMCPNNAVFENTGTVRGLRQSIY